MIHAYQEIYLSKAQTLLGEAFDYAVNICGISGANFMQMLAVSSAGQRMETGEPAILAGKGGIELAADIISETTGKELIPQSIERYDRSSEYWIGWAIAYYQWCSGRKFSEIFKVLTFDDLKRMYCTLHEADISKFADIADQRMREAHTETNLKRIRTASGYSQAQLANKSGIGLRSVQMYEQRKKDINKASSETVYRIAKTLGCSMESLIEK